MYLQKEDAFLQQIIVNGSAVDPEPHVVGPLGSGFVIICTDRIIPTHQQAKTVRKTLFIINNNLRFLLYFLISIFELMTDVNVRYLQKIISKKNFEKSLFYVGILSGTDEKRSRSIPKSRSTTIVIAIANE
jgi:hypothetical protein